MSGNTLQVWRAVKKRIEKEFRSKNLTVRSAGFKQDSLSEKIDKSTGFWEEPNKVSSKPPRMIIHFYKHGEEFSASFAKKEDGTNFPASNTIGYINNREGSCSAMLFRIIAAVNINEKYFEFPDWEWIMLLAFHKPLPSGNSSETISNFDPTEKSIVYQRKKYRYSLLGIIKTNVEIDGAPSEEFDGLTYSSATESLRELLEYEVD